MRKDKTYKCYTKDGVTFCVSYDEPAVRKGSDTPVRARVNIKLASGGKQLRKSEILDTDSNEPLNHVVYGKSVENIYKHHLPVLAEQLLSKLRACGLIATPEKPFKGNDLCTLIRTNAEDILAVKFPNVADDTRNSYGRLLNRLAYLCQSIDPAQLQGETLHRLRETICRMAAFSSRKYQDWQPGDTYSSTAEKQLNLLCASLEYLCENGFSIPVEALGKPTNKPSSNELALQRTDSARSYPQEYSYRLLPSSDNTINTLLLSIQYDTGLRISELCGLLWCDFITLSGSQGTMYMLRVSGQINEKGARIDTPKTDSGYRFVPLSASLGHMLQQRYNRLPLINKRLNLLPIILDDPAASQAYIQENSRRTLEIYRDFAAKKLRSELFEPLRQIRIYIFDSEKQNRQLLDSLTPHSLRRNYVTTLYTRSMEAPDEINQVTGHAGPQRKRRSEMGAATPEEQYIMCLRHSVAGVGVDAPIVLRYNTDESNYAEVLCLHLELTLPPYAQGTLVINETEPDTSIRFLSDDSSEITEKERFTPQHPNTPERLLANWDEWGITKKSHPMQEISWENILAKI